MTFGYAITNKEGLSLKGDKTGFVRLSKGYTPFMHGAASLKLGGQWVGEDGGESLTATPGVYDDKKGQSAHSHPELKRSVKELLALLNSTTAP